MQMLADTYSGEHYVKRGNIDHIFFFIKRNESVPTELLLVRFVLCADLAMRNPVTKKKNSTPKYPFEKKVIWSPIIGVSLLP